jgi:Flp pilus assembly protein TadG
MMITRCSGNRPRKGAVVVLLAVLLIPLLAMVAFAVDLAWITLVQAELQDAADAAAMAGAQQLQSGYVQYYAPGQTNQSTILSNSETSASTTAKTIAAANCGGEVSSLVLKDADIEFGYTDSSGNYTSTASYTGYPNTVKVTIRRDSVANGPLALFFGPAVGTKTASLKATAAATIYTGVLDSFKSNYSGNIKMLPMTYDVNDWNNYLNTGLSPDGTQGPLNNGAPTLEVYPSNKDSGNFGLISLDQSNDGASDISNWIKYGVPSTDLQNEFNDKLLPLSAHDPTQWNWKGDPGLRTDDVHTLSDYVGKTFLMPLFTPYATAGSSSSYSAGTGQGSKYYYNIVAFASVTITACDGSTVYVQPAAQVPPNAIYSSVTPAGPPTSGSPLVTTFAPVKLTQ